MEILPLQVRGDMRRPSEPADDVAVIGVKVARELVYLAVLVIPNQDLLVEECAAVASDVARTRSDCCDTTTCAIALWFDRKPRLDRLDPPRGS
jgi:hypothetical protein